MSFVVLQNSHSKEAYLKSDSNPNKQVKSVKQKKIMKQVKSKKHV